MTRETSPPISTPCADAIAAGPGRRLLLAAIVAAVPSLAHAADPPQPPAAAAPAEDGQWTMPAKNYAATRFSGLDQINLSIPASLAGKGSVNVVVTAGGKPSNPVAVTFQ